MKIQFFNKDTGEELPEPENGEYIILNDGLWIIEFCSWENERHVRSGEAWKQDINFTVKITE